MLFNVIAERSPKWKLTDLELDGLSTSTAALANKYGSTYLKFGVEFQVVFWSGLIILRRVEIGKKKESKKEPKKEPEKDPQQELETSLEFAE